MGKVRHLVTVFLAFITVVSGSVLRESSQRGPTRVMSGSAQGVH